jgi:hypothetical protein
MWWWNMIWTAVGTIAGFPDLSAWIGQFDLMLGGVRAHRGFAVARSGANPPRRRIRTG